MSAIMKRTMYGVRLASNDVDVELVIGDKSVRMDYDTANKMAVMLRGMARKAKRNAGDHSLKIVGFADLTDAVADELKAQRKRDGTAIFVGPS